MILTSLQINLKYFLLFYPSLNYFVFRNKLIKIIFKKQMSRENEHTNQQGKLAKKVKNFIYHPSDQVGSGFSSQVYKGINELEPDPFKKNIAIKVIQLSKIQNQVENYLLNNEVNALKLLKHPSILQTIDILMTKNNVYIVTQFCEGGDLLKHIKTNGPFNELRAMALIKDIIQGYKCIQQNRIIHRDLKTSNVFLSKGRAKIADFGFCEFVGQKKPQIAYNVGSPAYMSPQSYRQNHYTHKSDIWAIGIILYELLVGETPDRTLTYSQMANNLTSGKIKNIQNEQIKKILCTCFKKNLKDRIDSISLCELISIELNRLQSIYGSTAMNEFQTPTFNVNDNPGNQPKVLGVPTSRAMSPNKAKDIKFFKAELPAKQPSNQIVMPNNSITKISPIPQQNQFQGRKSLTKQRIEQQKINSIKPHTEYLLFLYRLLKFIVQLKSQRINQILLPLFRHRNMIESSVDQQYQIAGQQLQQYYKQFQYLKNRFDEVYLLHSKQPSSRKNIYKQKLDMLASLQFTQPQSLNFYRKMIKQSCMECLTLLDNKNQNNFPHNRNQVGIVMDYLIIWFQLLGLHLQAVSIPDIITVSKLQNIVKEQPKKLSPGHIELLKIKFNAFVNNIPLDLNLPFGPPSQAIQPNISKQSQSSQKYQTVPAQIMTNYGSQSISQQMIQPIQLGGPVINFNNGNAQYGSINQFPSNPSLMIIK